MYTIGTSAIQYVQKQLPELQRKWLNSRLVAWVGLEADRTQVGRWISPYEIFFQVTQYNPLTTAQLFVPSDGGPADFPLHPTEWKYIEPDIPQETVRDVLVPASTLLNAQYAFQRGLKSDMHKASAVPGIPYYCKDTNELYVYNDIDHDWKQIVVAAPDSAESLIITFPWALNAPTGYIRCDGAYYNHQIGSPYVALYGVIGNLFDHTTAPPWWPGYPDPYDPAVYFAVPRISNCFIRYMDLTA